MEIDTRFPTKLNAILDAPEPFLSALVENLPSEKTVRFLVHSPAFSTADENTPATLLAVTDDGWLVVSETEDGGTSVEKSAFGETLFIELTSIILLGQLKIYFAAVGTIYFATVGFDRVGEDLYREAIDLILAGVDQTLAPAVQNDWDASSMTDGWPIRFRTQAERYRPKGQQLSAAMQWPIVFGGGQRELAPAGALLVTERELVLILGEKNPTGQNGGYFPKAGGIITYFPLARLADFHVSHQDRFGVLALQLHAAHGGGKLEVIFPPDQERAIARAMENAVGGHVIS